MHLEHEGRRRPIYAPTTPASDGAGAGEAQHACPDRRAIRRALDVLLQLPREALCDLSERIINRLDEIEPECDLEPETDACGAGECGGILLRGDGNAGDVLDAEPDSDDEPDDDDRGDGEDEPRFPDRMSTNLGRVSRSGRKSVSWGAAR